MKEKIPREIETFEQALNNYKEKVNEFEKKEFSDKNTDNLFYKELKDLAAILFQKGAVIVLLMKGHIEEDIIGKFKNELDDIYNLTDNPFFCCYERIEFIQALEKIFWSVKPTLITNGYGLIKYNFSNGPQCSDSVNGFKGHVSGCLSVIDEFLEFIIKRENTKPKKFIGDKIFQFAEIYPQETITSRMKHLNRIRVILQHGKSQRKTKNANLEYIHKDGIVTLNESLVQEFIQNYKEIHNRLIEIKNET